MATQPNLATSGSMSPDILAVYMMDELLDRAEKDTVFWPLCEKSTIPKGSGKTVQFTRYERLPLPEAPLEESVTPVATPITQPDGETWRSVAFDTPRAPIRCLISDCTIPQGVLRASRTRTIPGSPMGLSSPVNSCASASFCAGCGTSSAPPCRSRMAPTPRCWWWG